MIKKIKNSIFKKNKSKRNSHAIAGQVARSIKAFSLFVFVSIIILGQLVSPQVASAATFSFSQSSWAGGATANTGTHASNQSNWTEYSAKTGVDATSTVSLTPSSLFSTQTSNDDFSGTNSQTVVSGNSVSVARSGTINPAIVSNGASSYALKSDGSVWAWGKNDVGQLGNNTTTNSSTPVEVSGLSSGVIAISSFPDSKVAYALKSDGSVWAWGSNQNVKLGNNTIVVNTYSTVPVQVMNVAGTGYLTGITAISSGTKNGYALSSNGTVYSWGDSTYGQLGNGSGCGSCSSILPVQVTGLGSGSGVTAIAGGAWNVYALKAGAVYSWGLNTSGQLGINTATGTSATPIQVHGVANSGYLTGMSSIAAGYNGGYALKSDGTVYAWGYNVNGELGDTSTTERDTPVQVTGLGAGSGVTALSASSSVYALKSDGTVLGWGYNGDGQLADGTLVNKTSPVTVSGLSSVGVVFTGTNSSFVLKNDGSVWSIGNNVSGQLGNNTLVNSTTFVQVLYQSLVNFNAGTTGIRTVIGNSNSGYALKNDGTVWAWGYNGYGELGNNTTTNSSTPVQVSGLTGITAIATAGYAAYALKNDGTVWAWGYNNNGQAGQNTTAGQDCNYDANDDWVCSVVNSYYTTPVQVHGVANSGFLTGITAIAAGYNSVYALGPSGNVYAWGYNNVDQIGDNTVTERDVPVQVHGVANSGYLTGMSYIFAGSNNGFAQKSDGTVYAWGYNNVGQLGDNTIVNKATPVQIFSAGSGVTSIIGNGFSTYARKSDGSAVAWGKNDVGQLGDGTTTERDVPTQISGLTSGVTTVTAGYNGGYALKSDGSAVAWGQNNYNQVGDSSYVNKSVPTQISGLTSGVYSIGAGDNNGYALKSDGTIFSWGLNSYGNLGDNTLLTRSSPVYVKNLSSIVNFSAGSNSYYSSGTYTSAVIDLGGQAGFTTLSYITTLGGQTATVDIRAGDTSSLSGSWTTNVSSGGDISGLGVHQYIQYRVNLNSDTITSPSLDSITINYTQYTLSGNLTSSKYNSIDATNLISKMAWTATGTSDTETVKFQVRSSPDGTTWTNWCGYADTGSTCTGTNYFDSTQNNLAVASTHPLRNGGNDQYVQYKAFLTSTGGATPTLTNASITYVINVVPTFDTTYGGGGTGSTAAQNSTVVSADFGKVNISYSAKDTDTVSGTITPNQMTPSFEYSINGGSSWTAIPSGDLAAGDTTIKTILAGSYTVYTATWDAKTTIPNTDVTNAKVRVSVNDNEAANNIATSATANFSLDTKAPTGGVVTFDAGLSGVTNSATVTIPMPTDQSAVQYLISDDPATQTGPVNTGWTAISGSTTIPWTFDSDIEAKSLKYQYKDAFGNISAEQTVSTQAPIATSSFMVQDTSNVNTPSYDMYLGWQAGSPTGFGSYKLEYATSADNVTYGAYTSIVSSSLNDVTSNYYVHRSLDTTKFYRYRLAIVGSNGNTSVRSGSYLTAKPDGIQNYSEGGGGSVATASKVENVVVTQNNDKTITATYKLTDTSVAKKVSPSYQASIFYSLGITLPTTTTPGSTITLSDASKLKSSGYIMINNEVIKYTTKTGNVLGGLTRSTWPTDVSSGRTTRTNTIFFAGTPVWIMGNGTTIAIINSTIVTGQDNTINWNTANESALIGHSYSNVSVRVVVHDNQDAGSGPLSTQNDYSENGIINTLDLTAPAISFSTTSGTAAESVTPAVLTLNLDRAYPLDTTVNYTLSGTATGSSDYTLSNGTVTITAGATTADLNIPIINDTLKETDETIIVTLSNPVNGVLGTNTVYTYTIIDDDALPTIQFDSTTASDLENVTSVNIPVSISEASAVDSTVDYSVTGGTATGGGVDYTLVDGTLTIPAGETTVNITATVTNDILKESDETIVVTLTNPTNVILGTNTEFTYTIQDDDTVPTINFTTSTSDVSENVGTANIPVSISTVYPEDVTVDYTVSGGTATGGGVDYTLVDGTLTIPAGETTVNIPVVIFDDNLAEDTETVRVTLSNPTNAILGTLPGAGGGPFLRVIGASMGTFSYTLNILDNDIAVTNAGSAVKATSAIVTWTTADYADSQVDYGIIAPGTDGAYNLTKSNGDKVLGHSIYLGSLTPSTHYYVKTTSTNIAGSITESTLEFDTTAGPVISNVSASPITDTTATITWTTDIPASSDISYSTDSALANSGTAGTADLVTSHSVVVTGLSATTTYYYLASSTDTDGNIGEDTNGGSYYSFVTTADMTPPVISEITTPIITPNAVAVVWKTNENADGQILFGSTSGNYSDSTTVTAALVLNHLATIGNLIPQTTYYYVIKSKDANNNEATSPEQTVTTTEILKEIVSAGGSFVGVAQNLYDSLLAEFEDMKAKSKLSDKGLPIISNIQITDITAFGATVAFETDKDTVAFIDYGKDQSYGLMAADKVWAKTHVIKLTGLSLGTDYYLKINAMDKSNNVGVSDEQTFKTKFFTENLTDLQKIDNVEQFQAEIESSIQSILPSLVPPFVDKPVVSDITENSATVTFHTNIKSFPVVSYASDSFYDKTKENPYNGEISDTTGKDIIHKLSLTNLKSNITYHVMAKAFSLPQVVGKSEDITFSTLASKIQASILDVKTDTFTVAWSTDVLASSIVDYKNLTTGISARVVDDAKNTSHSVKIENLSPGVTYEVTVSGVTEKGNNVEGGTPINVRTLVDVTPPVITNIKVDSALIVGRTDRVQTIVSWVTDKPSTSVVYYEEGSGAPDKPLANKQEDLELTKNHATILTTLKPGTVYRFTVSSTDNANNTAKPPVRTIITPRKVESIVDIIFKNFDETFNFVKNVR